MSVDRRDQFLLHLYDKLWDSIDRSESGVWQFVGLNAALFAVIALTYTDKLPVEIAGSFGAVIVFWGINIVINAGWWFNHNMNIVRNIERQFLSGEDYGQILPESYKQGRRQVLNALNRIHLISFVVLGIGLLIVSRFYPLVLLIFILGILLTAANFQYSRQSLAALVKGTRPLEDDQ